ncbi:SAM-dependent methyltransferase [bacterium]|nr:SAM-dependent methyltransferase [bacterium]
MSEKANTEAPAFVPGSFRDPSGFIFKTQGLIFRQINMIYASEYSLLMQSGLYEDLTTRGMLIRHEELDAPIADKQSHWKTLCPEQIQIVSYPYEWCFSQLKDAALLTLDTQLMALNHSMSLKDASAYNVQFKQGRPIFIDTLSFEPYIEGRAWVAYRQFCQHFLGPLALMSKCDIRLGQLMRSHIDGLPLDLVSKLLPRRSILSYGLGVHLHLHARSQKAYSASEEVLSEKTKKFTKLSRTGLIGIVEGLRSAVRKLKWTPGGTEWGDYYNSTNYSDDTFEVKRNNISEFLDEVKPDDVWDLGGNTGLFSRVASDKRIPTVCFDIDPTAVEANYRRVKSQGEADILPLMLDLTNPSGGLGWAACEREALVDRGPVDCTMALALIHHLCIANNVPISRVAEFFSQLTRKNLIIEFVPKADGQVQRLLRSRKDIFCDYDEDRFELAFSKYFAIRRKVPIAGSLRTLYLMDKN